MPRRHDVLDHWLKHRQITARQANAGRRFRDLYDVAGIEGHAFIDPVGPRASLVLGARGVAATRAEAQSELQALRPVLGALDFALVCRVVGAGEDILGATVSDGKKVTNDTHAGSDADRRYLAHRIRDALGVMAARFALAGA